MRNTRALGLAAFTLFLTLLGGGVAVSTPAHAQPASSGTQPAQRIDTSAHHAQPAPAIPAIQLSPRGSNCTINSSSIATCVPDPKLAAKIATALRTSTSATLTTALVDSLDTLKAQSAGIVSVEGIQHFTKLREIRIDNNQITDISPITGLPDLSTLSANSNQITTVGALDNPSLQSLQLQINKISSIASINWTNLTKLQNIDLANNQITDISPVTGLPSLTGLRAQNNQITNLGSFDNPNIEHLYLKNNKITSVSSVNWSNLTKLQNIDLANNQITDISPVTGLPSLTGLRAQNNQITNLGSFDNPNIEHLYLKNNKITSVSSVNWSNLTKLQNIDLDNNQITDISTITGLPSLTRIDANVNQITNVGNFNNPNITILNLCQNKISSIASISWTNLTKLQSLGLNNNQITDISTITGLPSLTHLNVDANQITNTGALNNPNLTYIILSHNKISSIADISWTNLTKLQTLSLYNNQITDISTITGLPDLSTLSANSNQITTVGALDNPSLQGLQLQRNKISSIASINWSNLTKLQSLDISNNQITDISPITGLPNLSRIEAYRNQITTVGALDNPSLTYVILFKNKIASIASANWSNLTKLQVLSLFDNEISDINCVSWNSLTELQLIQLHNNQITDISSIDWNRLTKITSSDLVTLSGQQLILPDSPGYTDDPFVLGPATISHNPDTYSPAAKDEHNNDRVGPAGYTYNANNGTYEWECSYPGHYSYTFGTKLSLPYASGTVSFDGSIAQQVPGLAALFDPNGGTLNTPKGVAVLTAGSTISEPNPKPTKSGHVLLGWYTTPTTGGSKWDFAAMPVNGNMTLYARWAPTFTLPQSGAIPLQQWGGGGLLATSALAGLTYASRHIRHHSTKRKQPAPTQESNQPTTN
ncbi:hypothetical protein KIMH_13990 [Bombiscardovia apis]|uniref:Uncharacterized protein n=1 Tax=Bombiscardovia apis TaxID=2932182 RepID=A0ABN6SJL7_9BIFI|nr:leucine-rich repeat domain-containing protein [Bombiscardovia apis]BDR55288.1 hypothetical protein KIMH_13990 [Bombiscardovia apis]